MAYKFKKLRDVEVVAEPTETANVLIEEGGVIKKAPRSAVGGGDTEIDAALVIEGSTFSSAVVTVAAGSWTSVRNKMERGIFPNISIVWTHEDAYVAMVQPVRIRMYEDAAIIQFMQYGNSLEVFFYSDNTAEVVGAPV